MKQNIGSLDKIIRLVAGPALILVGLFALGGMSGAIIGLIVAVIGLILIGTAAMGTCLIYLPLNFSTNKTEEKK